MPKREYTGQSLDQTWQDIKDRPYKGPGETVDDTSDQPEGKMRSTGVGSAVAKLSQDSKFEDIDNWISEMRNWDFEWRQELALDTNLPRLVRACIFGSILEDMSEYNAQVDTSKYSKYSHDLSVDMLRLFGDMPFHERQYIGDPALHDKYEEFITEALPARAPDPLNQPVG